MYGIVTVVTGPELTLVLGVGIGVTLCYKVRVVVAFTKTLFQ